ncbi:Type II secretion system protein G [Zhongshania aliphaticivorans]|uniref:Type II secretion system core protein G n=1 Tax=Zhongshania aliphaticivorans TaxID=1470434 RepID=A0A5S9QAW9_9GAMM|nr:type II secretion system major pseudopilin GspG [Zhongshania aliphaticivorans]CAA0087225.1 Type II secretion system protein G [Zhongshania aliphaticivorans]CAA0114333.1 Type II secretion system protein G [Zhongshania aliphaticivorans]
MSVLKLNGAACVNRNAKGFSLLEIMVVIVIMGLLVAVVAPNVLQNQDRAMVEKARADISVLEQALDMYKLDNHVYPTTDQGLQALVTRPETGTVPKNYRSNGYIKRLPEDPWGNAYIFIQPGEHGAFDLYSTGADGEEGGEELGSDIVNWQE